MNEQNKSSIGSIAYIFGIIAILTFWLQIIQPVLVAIFFFITIPLGLLSILIGGIAYWGKWNDKRGYTGFILGIISIVLGFILTVIFGKWYITF